MGERCGTRAALGDEKGRDMQARLNARTVAPEAYKAMSALESYVDGCGLERPLLELIKLRASQINGCAYCIDMHTKDARAAGETEQRLYELNAWRETPFYSDRERAALAWTEAVTLVSESHVPDDLYEEARRHFTEEELVNLTLAVVAINGWNRLAISFRAVPGTYQPKRVVAAAR
jgi:AhpD family alkylhydroperoxidase